MTYGIKALRRVQLGREATPGTIVVATAVWRGEGTIEDTRLVEQPSEDVGFIPDLSLTHITCLLTPPFCDLNEAMTYFLHMKKGNVCIISQLYIVIFAYCLLYFIFDNIFCILCISKICIYCIYYAIFRVFCASFCCILFPKSEYVVAYSATNQDNSSSCIG